MTPNIIFTTAQANIQRLQQTQLTRANEKRIIKTKNVKK